MSSHRRFVTSEASADYPALAEYGFFNITTNVADEIKSPTIAGYLDYVWGGFEKEDLRANPDAVGGTIDGKPVEGSAQYLIEQRNQDRLNDDILPGIDDWFKPDDPDLLPKKDIPWGRIALVAGVVVGGFIAYDKVIRPRLAKRSM